MPDARFSITDENDDTLDAALRDGLRRLPIPAVSADFDARVLAALARPPSVWEQAWRIVRGEVRPLLMGAACALPVTLLCLLWTLHAPAGAGSPALLPAAEALRAGPILGGSERWESIAWYSPPKLGGVGGRLLDPSGGPSLDALLDKPNLTAADLWKQEQAPTENPPALPPSIPGSRACLPCPPTLAA